VFIKRTAAIVMQQGTLTTALLSDQTTNHHFKVFVKCWSSAYVTCATSTNQYVATAWMVRSQL